MTFSGPYEGIQWPYGRILNGGDKKSERWLPIGVTRLFLNKIAKTQREKTQEIQNSSTILLKNSRYWNLFQIFNRNKLKKPK